MELLREAEININIIQEIFSFVFINASKTKTSRKLEANRKPNLKIKFDINFDENQQIIRTTFRNNIRYINLVKKFVEDQMKIDDQPVLDVVDRIQNLFISHRNKKYMDMKIANPNEQIFDFSIIDDIAIDLLTPEQKTNTHYMAYAKSIVLYFFELCDIGKIPARIKTPKPVSSQIDLFD